MVSDVMLAFDHLKHTVTVIANVYAGGGADLDARYAEAVSAIADVKERLAAPVPRARAGRREPPEWESNIGSEGYAAAVKRVKEYIRAGDAYQVVPSQRWTAEAPVEAFSIYRGLRTINPSPYMYFLDFEDFEIAGASPGVAREGHRPAGRAAPHRGYPAQGRHRGGGPRPRRRVAGRREGEGRARDARGPRPQRPRARVRVRQREGRRADGRRDLLARDAHSSRR